MSLALQIYFLIITVLLSRLLLRAGADPDATDNDLWTPLHAAAHWSLSDAAKVLAEYGANFSLENKNVRSNEISKFISTCKVDGVELSRRRLIYFVRKRQIKKSF